MEMSGKKRPGGASGGRIKEKAAGINEKRARRGYRRAEVGHELSWTSWCLANWCLLLSLQEADNIAVRA
jgi:hypothetical protein